MCHSEAPDYDENAKVLLSVHGAIMTPKPLTLVPSLRRAHRYTGRVRGSGRNAQFQGRQGEKTPMLPFQ